MWCVCVCVLKRGENYFTWGLRSMKDTGVIIRILNTTYRLNKHYQMQIYLTGLLNQKTFLSICAFLMERYQEHK